MKKYIKNVILKCKKYLLGSMIIVFSNVLYAQHYSFFYEEIEREYALHIPASLGDMKVPLVIALHGLARNDSLMEYHSHLSDKADEEGFIVAYPVGTGNPLGWNEGEEGIDDAGFINALIDTLIADYNIDRNKIFLTGFSNGAGLAYKVAQKYGQKIAAIAPVAGPLWDTVNLPKKPMRIIHFHAIDDPFVPYSNVMKVLNNWIDYNGCNLMADTFYVSDGAKGVKWTDNINGADIVLFSTDTGKHTWPGGEISWANPSNAISATDLMWNFFMKKPITNTVSRVCP